jgi:hypothetical protein
LSTKAASDRIKQELERASGKPVLVTQDLELPTIATISLANAGQPAHVLRYNPKHTAGLDYIIAFQCGFGLRSVQSVRPFDLTSGQLFDREVEQLIEEHFAAKGMDRSPDAIRQFGTILKAGLGQQLRSIPISIRVDSWIRDSFPVLAEQQRQCTEFQLQQQMQTLGPAVREVVPRKMYDASTAMNAAYAKFWATQWGEPQIALPFVAAGYGQIADSLLAEVQTSESGPDTDRNLVENWAEILKINNWFKVVDRVVGNRPQP